MDWVWKGLAGGTVSYLWSSWLLPAIVPIGAAVITATLGLHSSSPIPGIYIWLATLAAFSVTAIGLLRFDQWRERVRVANKLNFASVHIGLSTVPGQVALGFALQSSANFPMEFEVAEIRTKIQNRVPDKEVKLPKVYEIPPNGSGWFVDEFILLAEPLPKNASLTGIMEYKVKYGRPGQGRRKYELRGKKSILLLFDQSGNITGGGSVVDLV